MNKENLEKEFTEAVKLFDDEVSGYFEIAEDAIKKIVEISEKYGIPFETNISLLRNKFIPRSFRHKWLNDSEINKNDLFDLSDFDTDKYHEEGWKHSYPRRSRSPTTICFTPSSGLSSRLLPRSFMC